MNVLALFALQVLPLLDLEGSSYQGRPGGMTTLPARYDAATRIVAAAADPKNGPATVVFLGMSNFKTEVDTFIDRYGSAVHANLTLVNAARGGADIVTIANNGGTVPYWDHVRAAVAGSPPVRVVFLKFAVARPGTDHGLATLDQYEQAATGYLGDALDRATSAFPELASVHLVTRVHGQLAAGPLNPAPYPYWAGFAARSFIDTRLAASQVEPVVLWGLYPWTDGDRRWSRFPELSVGRSRAHFRPDGVHPSTRGEEDFADQLALWIAVNPATAAIFP